MNTSRLARVAWRAKWPVPLTRGAASKTPQPQKPERINPRLQPFEDVGPPPSQNGISPRVLTILGVTALGISTYCGLLYASYRREVTQGQSLDVPQDVSARYNETASTFDADVEVSEKAMRLGAKRLDLVRMARGDVLEISCGTGRNLDYYELGERRGVDDKGHAAVRGCRSLTFVDLSPQMVAITRQKFEKLHPGFARVDFRVQDAASVEPPSFPRPRSSSSSPAPCYDTVIQTMGLCSIPDPVAALRHLGAVTEPLHGRILLLEHGRSHYTWLNRLLDNLAPSHAHKHGCWWNRDIGAIVRESGLEVVEEKRWHFGTTWRYVLRPKKTV
ncbi:hypothetical protein NUU61_004882 [Penicillium alfredii]|uniref:Methyltransferase domain-containing protein n=1 Tax=Penicillium alfredii TaxID=1506179 RepID=A0A9W9F8F6_9EURO|nr:uncharacterized protein NUU61_004882 [Penicillium alfredii]KAJ5095526.1 hypothetical protein NUU61_004882 [Penicillium alfredii]